MRKTLVIAFLVIIVVVIIFMRSGQAEDAEKIEQLKQEVQQLEAEKEQLHGQLYELEKEYASLRDHVWNDRNYMEKIEGENN